MWQYDTESDGQRANFHGDPFFTDSLVVVGTDVVLGATGFLYAFERSSGKLRWKKAMGRGVPVDVLGGDAAIYAVTMQVELVALEAATGRESWRFAPQHGDSTLTTLTLTPVLAGDRVCFASDSGRVYAVARTSGDLLWETDLGAAANTSLAHRQGKVYIGTIAGAILRLDAATGVIDARFDTGGMPYGRLVATDAGVLALWFQGSADQYGDIDAPHTLAGLEPGLEAVRWSQESPAEWTSYHPLVRGAHVIAGNRNGRIQGFRLVDGGMLWSHFIAGVVRGLGFSDSTLFAGTLNGAVHALSWPQELPAAPSPTPPGER